MAKESASQKLFEEAKRLHHKGVDGDKKAVKEAFEKLAKLRSAEPKNALIEAYYGSSLALMGRDAAQPLERAEKAQHGLDALDRAVSMDPNRKEIRMLRANVCVRLPELYFQSSKIAIEDFNYLLERYKANPEYLTKKQVGDILKNLSTAYQNAGKPDQAKATLQRLAKLDGKKK
ncbi:tetratricopeptide repeat protein [Paenibacillus sp. GYB003]|uniref:tetratricopeptide repeat protein n=1 Tax=Paenibacillus sp. GYB003 TaxID=2994392 RepID=UPI002F96AA12